MPVKARTFEKSFVEHDGGEVTLRLDRIEVVERASRTQETRIVMFSGDEYYVKEDTHRVRWWVDQVVNTV